MSEARFVFEAALAVEASGGTGAIATVIQTQGSVPRRAGSKMLVRRDGTIVGTIGGGMVEARIIQSALRVMESGEACTESHTLQDLQSGDAGVCGGRITVFIEPIGFIPTVLVIGLGHVGKALAEVCKWAGYRVLVSDDRAGFCDATYLPGMDGYIACPPSAIIDAVKIGKQTYVAAVTRGLPVDLDLLPALLATEAAYIGVIGSRRRWALTAKALKEEKGLKEAQIARIFAPIGIELKAETPHEIAISILAQIIQVQRGQKNAEPTVVQE